MSGIFQTFARLFPGRKDTFEVRYYVSDFESEQAPAGSVVSDGDSFTLHRYFTTEKAALQFGRYLYARYAQPNCLPPPTLHNLKLDLLLEVV